VRWLCIVALWLAYGRADARPGTPAREDTSDFWRDIIEPHSAAVTAIVAKARTALEKASESDGDGVEQRTRSLGEAYGMLRHARKLSPENVEVLTLLGLAADELGKTRQALDALDACVQLAGDRTSGEVAGRLGMIYLRLGKLDDAVRWLRTAQGPIASSDHAVAAVQLATALAARGEMPDAIDVLANALPAQSNYFTEPVALVSFALAVHYDRDEQRSAAFDVLDRMQAALQQELGPLAQRALAGMRFAPAEDQYYYQALLYETLGHYTEARAEWALYASLADAPWRGRALDHLQAIDHLMTAQHGRPEPQRSGRPSHRMGVP
jgi:tetratricopeptide (TPR) repeat protein